MDSLMHGLMDMWMHGLMDMWMEIDGRSEGWIGRILDAFYLIKTIYKHL